MKPCNQEASNNFLAKAIASMWRRSCLWLFLLILLPQLAGQASGEVSGLWNVGYNVEWSTPQSPLAESSVTSIFQNATVLNGKSSLGDQAQGLLTGFDDGSSFNLITTFYIRPVLVMRMEGRRENDLLQGTFVAASADGKAWQGAFSASLINPDPAFLAVDAPEAAPLAASQADVQIQTALTSPQQTQAAPETSQNSRFFDISYTRDTIYPRPVI